MATPLEMSRAKHCIDLSDQILPLFCMVLHGIVVCLFMFDWMFYDILVYGIYCLYCLLNSFPNCHSVRHPNNNVCILLQQFCGGSNHASLVFIRFRYPVVNSPTRKPKSLDHFLLTVMDKPCHSDQHNVHYIIS